MKKLLLMVGVLITMNSCFDEEKAIIKSVSLQYLNDFPELFQNGKHNKILSVKELPNYEGHLIFRIKEDVMIKSQSFTYTYSFKHNNVYIFVSRLNKGEKLLTGKLHEQLSVSQDGLIFDPYIYYLVINPVNFQYVIIDDNQRYLDIEELHKEIVSLNNDLK